MFRKIVAIEPVSLVKEAEEELRTYAEEAVFYEDIPADDEEIVRRIGDADGVLVSYTSRIGREVLERCPQVRYVGMCCSLYSEASANVDIAYARERGITVLGIRDYGDRGVVEFVLCELVRILHGYDRPMWRELPRVKDRHHRPGRVRGDDRRCPQVYGRGRALLQPHPKGGPGGGGPALPAFGPAPAGMRRGVHLPQ